MIVCMGLELVGSFECLLVLELLCDGVLVHGAVIMMGLSVLLRDCQRQLKRGCLPLIVLFGLVSWTVIVISLPDHKSLNVTTHKPIEYLSREPLTQPLHGFLIKSGMPPGIHVLYNMAELRVKEYFKWLRNVVAHGDRTHPPIALGENSGEGCQILINHHYKFIWIKGYKVGGTSARASLGNICGDRYNLVLYTI